MEKYVTTGGAGCKGSHIPKYLSSDGRQVIVLNSLNTNWINY